MSQSFATLAYTPNVREMQRRYGSREAQRHTDVAQGGFAGLSQHEARFIAERDSFYQSTVSESGWPFVQHRGGPAGFLKIIDSNTVGYADFGGNAQYVSVGNLTGNDRVALILMDYANRHRLKLLGRARVVHADEQPELLAQFVMPGYRARIERAIVIDLCASDWNCPQHLTRRFTEAQVEEMIAPILEENRRLRSMMQN